MKTRTIKGSELAVGDRIAFDGGPVRVTDIITAPLKIEFEDGSRETPKWAYLANGEHVTICKNDEIDIAA